MEGKNGFHNSSLRKLWWRYSASFRLKVLDWSTFGSLVVKLWLKGFLEDEQYVQLEEQVFIFHDMVLKNNAIQQKFVKFFQKFFKVQIYLFKEISTRTFSVALACKCFHFIFLNNLLVTCVTLVWSTLQVRLNSRSSCL